MLNLKRNFSRGIQPGLGIIAIQNDRHRRGMDRLHHRVRVGGQNAEQQMFALLFASQAGPWSPRDRLKPGGSCCGR
jgi:hypothetical protein